MDLIFSDNPAELLFRLQDCQSVYVVADSSIVHIHTDPLVRLFRENGVNVLGLTWIKAKEKYKTFATVEHLHKNMIACGVDRNTLVLTMGGGITSDLAGFAACTYMRGVPYANIPTTLLAQVDAAIGGKTACNVGVSRNMAGVIRQPKFTFICGDFLRTLPRERMLEGWAEMLKTFIIADPQSYSAALEFATRAFVPRMEDDCRTLDSLVHKAASIKAQIVSLDEQDRGERRKLNLGHSFAHAIESKSRFRISHGNAVSMGIIMAARLSEERGVAAPGLAGSLEQDFKAVGLPVECPWTREELEPFIMRDKKRNGGDMHYVLIRAIGDVIIEAYDLHKHTS